VSYVRNLRITSFKNALPEKNKNNKQTKLDEKEKAKKYSILNFLLFSQRDTNKAKLSLTQERTLLMIFSSLDS